MGSNRNETYPIIVGKATKKKKKNVDSYRKNEFINHPVKIKIVFVHATRKTQNKNVLSYATRT